MAFAARLKPCPSYKAFFRSLFCLTLAKARQDQPLKRIEFVQPLLFLFFTAAGFSTGGSG
jgi:hypothetical protein